MVSVAWGTAPTPEIAIVADASGEFAVALPRGRFRIRADAGGASGSVDLEVGGGGELSPIEIRLGSH